MKIHLIHEALNGLKVFQPEVFECINCFLGIPFDFDKIALWNISNVDFDCDY